MHHVLLNLKSFFKSEKLVFFIMLICVISSAFIINFAYGLYYNYDIQKSELNLDTKQIYPEMIVKESITKGDFKRYVEALDDTTLNSMEVMYAMSLLYNKYPEIGSRSNSAFYMRFVIHDGKYGISEPTRKAYEENGLLTSGRFITNEEEQNASLVAIVAGNHRNGWAPESLVFKNDDGTITMFGKEYEVIGVYNAGCLTPHVPFLTVPDDLPIYEMGFAFERNVTRSIYNDLVETANREIPGVLEFPELQFPDNDSIAVYNNVISIAFFISIVSVVNFAMLYHFIIEKRQRNLAIMRMCGCTKSRAVFTYLAECIIITLPCYAVGTLLNAILGKNVFGKIFDFFEEAYTPKIYLAMFAVYFIAFIIILTVMISKTITRTIIREWKE